MNNTTYPVLEYIVNLLKNAIADAKVEKQSDTVSVVKDGNDTIRLEQLFDNNGNSTGIAITDKKDIIFSEDLFETLDKIDESAKGDATLKAALKNAIIIINDLDVETQLIFQSVKDCFDQLSNSYEFVKINKKEVNKLKAQFKFGKHSFDLSVVNEANEIFVTADFAAAVDAPVRKTIEADILKVQNAINKIFKDDLALAKK